MNNKLKPYQVGENDIVAATSKEEALAVLMNEFDWHKDEVSDFDIEDISHKLDMKLADEEGNLTGSLGDLMDRITEPQHLFVWD